jgi:DNA-binding protein HU-beta
MLGVPINNSDAANKCHPAYQCKTKGEMMNKTEIVAKISSDVGISKAAAAASLSSFVDVVTKTLQKKDGKLTIAGFGTFSKGHRKARTGRNPQTGQPIHINATTVVKFKAGKKLIESVE